MREFAVASAREMVEHVLPVLENANLTLAADAPSVDQSRLLRAQADLALFVGDLAKIRSKVPR